MEDTPSDPTRRKEHPIPRDVIHLYWTQPWDGDNDPQSYIETGRESSEFLVEIVKRYVSNSAKVLEIGCNAGRNLYYLHQNGFRHLEAVEISPAAVDLFVRTFPEVSSNSIIYNAPVEKVIKKLKTDAYDLVFSMAVLEHIHYDSDWIFAEMVRISRDCLITLEDERGISGRHFPRNYEEVFVPLGMEQVEHIDCTAVFGDTFEGRVFRKPRPDGQQ